MWLHLEQCDMKFGSLEISQIFSVVPARLPVKKLSIIMPLEALNWEFVLP